MRLLLPAGEPVGIARLAASRGTRVPGKAEAHLAYDTPARIPKLPWRALSASELLAFTVVAGSPDWSASLAVLRIPWALVRGSALAACADASTQADASALCTRSDVADAIAQLVEYCRQYSAPGREITQNMVAVRAPGLVTTTFDQAKGVRVGLHIDSWDRAPTHLRAASRNRINVNLGFADRSLLFVARPIGHLAETLEPSGPAPLGPTQIARRWLAAHPDEPVYRLRVKPGEAYLAPTECIPHDSSTLGSLHADVSLSLLGHFSLPQPGACLTG